MTEEMKNEIYSLLIRNERVDFWMALDQLDDNDALFYTLGDDWYEAENQENGKTMYGLLFHGEKKVEPNYRLDYDEVKAVNILGEKSRIFVKVTRTALEAFLA